MLQRGIETPDMDVRWVSSLSWYFLNLFGLNGLFRLILGNENCELHFSKNRWRTYLIQTSRSAADSSQDLASSPFAALGNNSNMQLGPGQDMNKIFLQEKENLELADGLYKWAADGVEQRMLDRWAKSRGSKEVRGQKQKTS